LVLAGLDLVDCPHCGGRDDAWTGETPPVCEAFEVLTINGADSTGGQSASDQHKPDQSG